jgi:hypothetical protein
MEKLTESTRKILKTIHAKTKNYQEKNIRLIIICQSRPKSASFRSESEFSSRGAAEARKWASIKGTFWQRCPLNFLDDITNYKGKDITGKITNLFFIYLYQ